MVYSVYLLLSNDVCIKTFYILREKELEATAGRGVVEISKELVKYMGDGPLILKKREKKKPTKPLCTQIHS